MTISVADRIMQLRQAFRSLWMAKPFTATAVGTLGLAIGASASIFTLVDRVLLNPLPYPEADRLVVLQGSAPGTDVGDEFNLSAEFLIEFQRQADLLESVASFNSFTSTLRTDERVARVRMSSPSLSLFSTLGATPQLGRLPEPEEIDSTAVISHDLWMDWFGGDPNVIGRSYAMAGRSRTIVGVMPAEFDFPNEGTLLWFANPLGLVDTDITPGRFGLPLVARVRPGVSSEELVSQLDLIASRLPEQYGGSAAYAEIIDAFTTRVVPFKEFLLGSLETPLMILLGATGILLAIACANVTNLFLARAEGQRRDIAIRCAIGAPLGKLVRRQLTETTIVALLAGVLAVCVAMLLLPAILSQIPDDVPRIGDARLSPATFVYTVGISIVAGLACGIAPAVRTAGVSLTWLSDGSRSATGVRHWARNTLVIGQAALALLLLAGSGLLLRSSMMLRNVDPGYVTEDIFTFQMAPEQAQLTDGPSWANFHLAFMDRLRSLPGVETVGIVENFPLNEGTATLGFATEQAVSEAAPEQFLNLTFAAGDYFEAMEIDLLRGRVFTEGEHTRNPGYIIVSQSAADRMWPGDDPLGKRLRFNEFDTWETVIGVVEDVRQYGFRNEVGPDVYFPLVAQADSGWALSSPAYVLKTARAASIAPEVRALVREVAPEAPMYRIFTIENLVSSSMARLSFTTLALGLAAALAMFLGMVGLYGILSSTVAERTRELGIRIALGANPGSLRRMVVIQGVRVVIVGVVIGLFGVILGARSLESLLFGVQGFDVITLVVTTLVMLSVGAAASWIPAYRASSVDPVETLAEA
jgi:putative ABC transport system permease protein